MSNPSCLMIDDQNVVREVLALSLSNELEITHATTAAEALTEIALRSFDIVITEIALPDRRGSELIRELKSVAARVVVLSCARDEFNVSEAMRSGADGYVSKHASLAEVRRLIRVVLAGGNAFSADVGAACVRALHRKDLPSGKGDLMSSLSDRERQVLRLLALGKSTREAAEHLKISPKTVETHRGRMFVKLSTNSVADLTRLAMRSGLVEF